MFHRLQLFRLRDSFVRLWQLERDKEKWNKGDFMGIHEHIDKLIKESFEIIDSKLRVEQIIPEIYKNHENLGTRT